MSCILGSVQQKISCLFEVEVLPNSPSSKRIDQSYKVVATDRLREKVSAVLLGPNADGIGYVATEKLDGTCVFIAEHCGMPWLWARHDRKPNKAACKRFKKFQNEHPESLANCGQDEVRFAWQIDRDFKDIPSNWIPATGCSTQEGIALPDANGHIPGWVPLDLKSRQHCWHLSAVDLNTGVCLTLQRRADHLEISLQPLNELLGVTMELIGTNINGNPYNLGSKLKPLHLLVRHGVLPVENLPSLSMKNLSDWFQSSDGGIEGIVWHFQNGEMYKLHRHHLNLTWPIDHPKLLSLPVFVNINKEQEPYLSEVISTMVKFSGQTFDSLRNLTLA